MQIIIIHPEQWNGGSDRCTVALIRHLKARGHHVIWYTTMIDDYWKHHDFEGIDVREHRIQLHPGDWWSQNIYLGWKIISSELNPDLVILDHSASCVPMLKWRFPQCRVLFYCHFPQQLVTPNRFFLYRWYSKLIGVIEEELFMKTDRIMVNSIFTGRQFAKVMPNISQEKIRVVYPPCDIDSIVSAAQAPISRRCRPTNERYLFLSMNRFWPEKRLDIIVEAAAILKSRGFRFHVQLAGSVMPHIPESRIYYELLRTMSHDLDVEDVVEFIASPNDQQKFMLYRQCDTALYTPPDEHFGIVPIEALDQRRPVIVCNSGGPAETVIEDVTGTRIAEPRADLLAEAMIHHMKREEWPDLDTEEGYCKQRVRFERDFSTKGYCDHIDAAIADFFPNYAPLSSTQLQSARSARG